jgi:predicted hydrocarbon binding protein
MDKLNREESVTLRCSNLLMQVVQEGVKEIIGQAGVNAVLNLGLRARLLPQEGELNFEHDLTFEEVASLQIALESLYGPRGGRGIALRAGRASFAYFLRQFGERAGLTQMDFRLLPTHARLSSGLDVLARLLSMLCHISVRLEERPEHWVLYVENCPECFHRQTQEVTCHFWVGFLQEFMTWASNGRYYPVMESECAAMGAPACVFQIDQQALD